MKKFIYGLIGLGVALVFVNPVALAAGRRAISASVSVTTNAATLASANNARIACLIYNSSGTETVRVGFVASTTYAAKGALAINPGSSLVLPSSTYPFVPGTIIYGQGNTANVTNTVLVTEILE